MYDILIIGGGIVGLATALKLKEGHPDLKVLLVEKEARLCAHQTGNNSGVIHSGLYYRPGSLKARNCRHGYRLLLELCDREGIAYEICGKIVVATTSEELPLLDHLYQRGLQNGLDRLEIIPGAQIGAFEPACVGLQALWVPYTGIIDYREVGDKYAELFTGRYGGEVRCNSKVIGLDHRQGYSLVHTDQGSYEASLVINCGGLYCDKIALLIRPDLDVRIIPFRGEYLELKAEKRHLVKNLIYPVPDPAFPFLGVHFTRMKRGGVEAGPNAVFAFRREGYKKTDFSLVETMEALLWPGFRNVIKQYWRAGLGEYQRSFSKSAMTEALQRLIPDLSVDDLQPGGAGVRAQACDRAGKLIDDFLIVEDERMLNVLNAPSPAATASLAIGETVADLAIKHFYC
ncbi:MAG: L-2-hydroxyglutarate oxidase [Desulfofustis sp.]|nr:L-2-hydroxyglutarate oxidase [Desulfofustis sp.]